MADLTWTRPAYNGTALATGVIASPLWTRVLHIAGDQYGVALAAVTLAAWLDHHRRTWPTRALLFTVAVGSLACWPAVADTLTYLTGVTP